MERQKEVDIQEDKEERKSQQVRIGQARPNSLRGRKKAEVAQGYMSKAMFSEAEDNIANTNQHNELA